MIPLAVALIVGIALAAIRTPLVRRIGLRNAVRRPREAALVMLGCVLGTALIVGSGTVSDSFTASIRDKALSQLGAIDARVNYESAADWSAANARLIASPIDGVRTAASAASVEVPLTSNSSAVPAPRAKLIEVDYRHAGELTKTTGVAPGTGPTPGTAWASPTLAKHLGLKIGSILTIHTRVPNQRVLVTKIVNTALVALSDSPLETGDNLLVAPGTISILQRQDTKAVAPSYFTLVSAKGPHTKSPPAAATTERLRTTLTSLVSPFNGSVSMVRADRLATAKAVGDKSGQFLLTIGGFGIIAGIMLLVNVLLMLAEERLAELGTMRAVGLSRRPLIASFALEGALYAIIGATLGGLAGLGVGRLMVTLASRATQSTARSVAGLSIHFSAKPSTVLSGIAAGFLVATIVVLATSLRVSRMDVIRALRGLPDPPRQHRQAATPILIAGLILGPILCVYGYQAPKAVPFLASLAIFFACVGVFVSRRRGYVAGITASCGPIMLWAVVFQALNREGNTPPEVAIFGGVLTTMSGVLFVNAQQARLARLARRLGRGRATVTSRLGLANPIAHRVRMLLTVAPFALVVFTLVYAEGLSSVLVTEVNRLAPSVGGDYQVFASSSPVNPFDFSKVESSAITAIAPTSSLVASFTPAATSNAQQQFWALSAFDQSLTKATPPLLLFRSSSFKSDSAAYNAVAKDPDLIIVPSNFLFDPNERVGTPTETRADNPVRVGATYTMFDPVSGAARDVTVAAVSYGDVTDTGAFYGEPGAKQLFGTRVIRTSAFIGTTGDAKSFATQLEQSGVDNGVKADAIEEATKDYFAYVTDVINLYRSDLGIGIVVGVAGIGVVLVRSVRDRRRQIGALRAMGFDGNQIGWSFLIEGGFVALQALAVGVGLGVITVMAQTQGQPFKETLGYTPDLSAPSPLVAVMAVGLFLAAILASVAPARRASRIPPAVALRLVD